jgi:2-polyprenyl-3-methyl-5-hydroxy-6-metoxy-1,4-benzoquinol methylase
MPGFTSLRYYFRRLVYENSVLQQAADRWLEHRRADNTAAYWNEALASDFSNYLGGTLSIDLRNAIVAALIRHHVEPPVRVLDIGCSGGSLAGAIDGLSHYTGTDVSDYAVAHAKRAAPFPSRGRGGATIEFIAADLRDFPLNERRWDVIVFNEVLYYLPVPEALDQIGRYAQALRPSGILCISMKDDGKCRAIFRRLQQHYVWKIGTLHQIKCERPDFKIRINRERPAHLISVLQPRDIPI